MRVGGIFAVFVMVALLGAVPVEVAAQAAPPPAAPRLALLAVDNLSGDPRYDYLGAIVQGLLLYDLSRAPGLELVDRADLDAALRERELALSALGSDQAGQKTLGQVLGADRLLRGEYVLVGNDLLLTLKLVEVATMRVSTFAEAGRTENLVHGLVERLVERLTGSKAAFREEGRSRSLLSLRDESPGSIALHSPLVDALVYLDGAFAGYTKGDRRVPVLFEGLEPGEHEIATDLGRDFGVVDLPAVKFRRWSAIVKVEPGKRIVVVDESQHFNQILYALSRLVDEDLRIQVPEPGAPPPPALSKRYEFRFLDRAAAAHTGAITLEASLVAGPALVGRLRLELDGTVLERELRCASGATALVEERIGLVDFAVEAEESWGRFELSFDAERSDIRQGMHRE